MRAFAPALLSALLFTQVGCAANSRTEFKRNGASISLVLEIEVQSDPDYISTEEHEPQNQPIYVEVLIQDEVQSTSTEKMLLTAGDKTSPSLKGKMLWPVEERTKDTHVETENRQNGTVQRSEESPSQTRIEHIGTQKQLQVTDDTRASTLLETKHTKASQNRTESTDVQTERRQGSNATGSEKALAQNETDHTATQKQVPAAGDGAKTLLKTKSLDIPQEQLNEIDSPTERRLGGGVPRSKASLAQNETERRKTQKEVLATADRSNTLLETKPLDVPQERSEDVDSETERRQDGDAPRNEGALAQNESDHTATQKQVPALGEKRTSAFLETKPFQAGQNRTEAPDVQIEKRRVGKAQGNEVLASSFDNDSGATQVETARDIEHVLKDSKGTESSRNSSQREATDSWKGNVTSQGSDRSTTTESVRHIVLEERHLVLDERQMTMSEASAAREVNEVSWGPTKDLQEESEVTNGSTANGPKREKVISMLSEAKVRRANRERNDVLKDAVEITQEAARPTVMSLQQEDVQRQDVTTTEGSGESRPSRLERNGASRNANDRPGTAERDVAKFTEDSTSGRGAKTSTTGRSLMSQDAGEIEVDSSLENPNKLTMRIVDERRVLLQTDATTVSEGDYVQKAIGIRAESIVPATGTGDEGSGWESDLYLPDFW